jgi:hypothetical protein
VGGEGEQHCRRKGGGSSEREGGTEGKGERGEVLTATRHPDQKTGQSRGYPSLLKIIPIVVSYEDGGGVLTMARWIEQLLRFTAEEQRLRFTTAEPTHNNTRLPHHQNNNIRNVVGEISAIKKSFFSMDKIIIKNSMLTKLEYRGK